MNTLKLIDPPVLKDLITYTREEIFNYYESVFRRQIPKGDKVTDLYNRKKRSPEYVTAAKYILECDEAVYRFYEPEVVVPVRPRVMTPEEYCRYVEHPQDSATMQELCAMYPDTLIPLELEPYAQQNRGKLPVLGRIDVSALSRHKFVFKGVELPLFTSHRGCGTISAESLRQSSIAGMGKVRDRQDYQPIVSYVHKTDGYEVYFITHGDNIFMMHYMGERIKMHFSIVRSLPLYGVEYVPDQGYFTSDDQWVPTGIFVTYKTPLAIRDFDGVCDEGIVITRGVKEYRIKKNVTYDLRAYKGAFTTSDGKEQFSCDPTLEGVWEVSSQGYPLHKRSDKMQAQSSKGFFKTRSSVDCYSTLMTMLKTLPREEKAVYPPDFHVMHKMGATTYVKYRMLTHRATITDMGVQRYLQYVLHLAREPVLPLDYIIAAQPEKVIFRRLLRDVLTYGHTPHVGTLRHALTRGGYSQTSNGWHLKRPKPQLVKPMFQNAPVYWNNRYNGVEAMYNGADYSEVVGARYGKINVMQIPRELPYTCVRGQVDGIYVAGIGTNIKEATSAMYRAAYCLMLMLPHVGSNALPFGSHEGPFGRFVVMSSDMNGLEFTLWDDVPVDYPLFAPGAIQIHMGVPPFGYEDKVPNAYITPLVPSYLKGLLACITPLPPRQIRK